jgi:hypothetical protein
LGTEGALTLVPPTRVSARGLEGVRFPFADGRMERILSRYFPFVDNGKDPEFGSKGVGAGGGLGMLLILHVKTNFQLLCSL